MKTRRKVLAMVVLAVAALVAVKLSYAQNGSKPVPLVMQAPSDQPLRPMIDPATGRPTRISTPAGRRATDSPDPVHVVDAYEAKSRREAEESVAALDLEAETLRNRLAKVEAALGRWRKLTGGGPQGLTTEDEPPPIETKPSLDIMRPFDPKIPAPGPSLEAKRVVILMNVGSESTDQPDLKRELASEIASNLRKNVKKVVVIDPRLVATWVDAHPGCTDPSDVARIFSADFAIFLDVSKFGTENPSSPDLMEGTSNIHIQVWKIEHPKDAQGRFLKDNAKEGSKVYEEQVDTTYPVRGPIPMRNGISPASFRDKFLKVVANQVSWHFYDHAVGEEE